MVCNADGQVPATLIPGDGIGPEVAESVVEVLDALGKPFTWISSKAGWRRSRRSPTHFRRRRWTAFAAPVWR
jgi:isocitrate/isopropylmalate dehydrogenase